MGTSNEYIMYQKSICEIPTWLKKYLKLDIMQRLKGISLLCGMEYGSKHIYDFAFYISRYDHSLSTALITWKLTKSKEQTLAALFHDIASPAFSHVIDYMNGDFVTQESTEGYSSTILNNSSELVYCLQEDDININDIMDFKQYSIVDLERPNMCADRLDNTIAAGMNWAKVLSGSDAIYIVNHISTCINEDGFREIEFTSANAAKKFLYVNDVINKLTHSDGDTYMMLLLSDIIKKCIKRGFFKYYDLYVSTEADIVEMIEENLDQDFEIEILWNQFKSLLSIPEDVKYPEVKNKVVNPLVNKKRLVK